MRAWLSVLLLCFLLSCTKKPTTPENLLRYPLESEPPTLDWSLMTEHVSFEVAANLHVGLTRYDSKMKLLPALAEKWEISKDEKTYTFYLRDAKWSDGVSVKAEDFVYGWLRLLNPRHASPYAYFLFDIEGAENYNHGKTKNTDTIGIRALSDKRLRVTLRSPTAYFLHLTAFSLLFPTRKDVVESHPTDFTEPNYLRTAGPYRLTEWKHDSRLVLEPNPYYFGSRPKIAKVIFPIIKEDSTALNLYERGELDIALRLPPLELERLRKLPDYKKLPHLRQVFIGYNTRVKPFDNPLVRKAFGHAVDREAINAVLKHSKIPMTSWIPKGLLGYNKSIGLTFQPTLAKELLAQAGYSNGKNFPKITYLYDSLELNRLVAEKLQFQWKSVLNIDSIELQTQEWKVYLDTLQNSPPSLFKFSWGADYPDPHTFMGLFASTSGWNPTGWKQARYDAWIKSAVQTSDEDKRKPIYDKAQRLLLEKEAVITPLYEEAQQLLIKPYVKNFAITPLEAPLFGEAWIEGAPPLPPVK